MGFINCRDDADTDATIVAECLKHAMKVNVECRGEDLAQSGKGLYKFNDSNIKLKEKVEDIFKRNSRSVL